MVFLTTQTLLPRTDVLCARCAWRKREGGREGKGGRECAGKRIGDGQSGTAKERV